MEKWKLELTNCITRDLEYKRWNLVKGQKEEDGEERYKKYSFEEAYQIYKKKYPDKRIERKNFYLYAIEQLYNFYDFIPLSEINANIDKRLDQEILERCFQYENSKDDDKDIFKYPYVTKIDEKELEKIEKDIESKRKKYSSLIEEKKKEEEKRKENIKKVINYIEEKKEEIKKKKKQRLRSTKRKERKARIKKIEKYTNNTMQKMCEEYKERNLGLDLELSTFNTIINEYAAAVGLKEPFNKVNSERRKIKCRDKTKEFFWKLIDCVYGNSVVNKNMSKTEIEEYRKCRNEIEIENADPLIRQEILWEFVDHILWKSIINQYLDNKEKKKTKEKVKFKNIILITKISKKSTETKKVISSCAELLNDNGITGTYSCSKIIKDIKMEMEDFEDKLFIENENIEAWTTIDVELKKIKDYKKDIMKRIEDYFLQPEYLNIFNREVYITMAKIYSKISSEKEKLLEQENIYDRKKEIFEDFMNKAYKEIKQQVSYIEKYKETFLNVCIKNEDINITELICLGNYIRTLLVVCINYSEISERYSYLDEIELYYEKITTKVRNIRNNPEIKEQNSIGWYKQFSKKLENISKLEKEIYSEDKELKEMLKNSNEIMNAVVAAIQMKIFYIMNDEEIRKKKMEGFRNFVIN